MKKVFEKIVNSFFHIFKIRNDVIIFECGRNKVDDNPLAIYEYMKKSREYETLLSTIYNKLKLKYSIKAYIYFFKDQY